MANKNTTATASVNIAATITRKDVLNYVATIGTAATAEDKFAAAKVLHDSTTSEYVRELAAAYMNGNKKPLKVSNLVGVTAENGAAAEHYNALMLKLYVSAIKYADATAANLATADKQLFDAWKEYLAIYPNEITATECRDCERLAAFVRSTVTAILTAEKYTTASGKVSVRSLSAIATDSPKAIAGFARSVERFAIERMLGFDGVLARVTAREIRKANKEKRDAILAAAAPVQIDKAATAAKKSTKATAKKATAAA